MLFATVCSAPESQQASHSSLPTSSPDAPHSLLSTTQQAATLSSTATTQSLMFSVVLHPESEQRPDAWQRTLSVAYGLDKSNVGLSRGGDSSAPVYFGPESASPVTHDKWWIVDTANKRIASLLMIKCILTSICNNKKRWFSGGGHHRRSLSCSLQTDPDPA